MGKSINIIPLFSCVFAICFGKLASALDIEGSPDELQNYVNCVYELRGVELEDGRHNEHREVEKYVSQVIEEAFAVCKKEELQLREFGEKQGLNAAEIDSRVAETKEQLAIAIRLTLASELTKIFSGITSE